MTDSNLQNPENSTTKQTVKWAIDSLRHTSPYINTHRGKTFVIWFSGTLLDTPHFTSLVHDLTLLSHLGIKLVLVHGMRAQIDTELAHRNLISDWGSNGAQPMRITSNEALPAVRSAAAYARYKLESAFSTGLPNSPMSGAQITLGSGNLIVAKPFGIRAGIDYQHTGEIRKVRQQKIQALLHADMVALLSPIGYSPTGEMFNLLSKDVATRTAVSLKADKLIFLHRDANAFDHTVREVAARNSAKLSQLKASLHADLRSLKVALNSAIDACQQGVNRSHIVDANQSDSLLRELFTRDGSGLMIDSGNYDTIRPADNTNISGIVKLINPLIQDGTLAPRTEQDLEREIHNFYVIEREGSVICCASLTQYGQQAEVGCLAVHPDFRASGKARDMLDFLITEAKTGSCSSLFVLSTRSGDWFLEQGFTPASNDSLPDSKTFESQRGSKVYTLPL